MALAGVYYRMENHDPTKYFNNGMRLSIEGAIAFFETTRRGRTALSLHWVDASTFEVDWAPVCSRWGRGRFRLHHHGDVRGLLEDGLKF